jgi:hypothetical protein
MQQALAGQPLAHHTAHLQHMLQHIKLHTLLQMTSSAC